MGTVRREGDWRLEKRQDGVYEITFRKEPQMKVFTSDASPGSGHRPLFDTIPVREVRTYSEAEGFFEEKAHGPPPLGMEYSSSQTSAGDTFQSGGEFGDDIDLSDVPPGALGLALLLAGSFVLYTFWGAGNDIALLMGAGFAVAGVAILSYGVYLFRAEGWRKAWDYFVTVEEDGHGRSTSDDSAPERTPSAPESLKNELFFERAHRRCEYCGDQFDQPDVHHIKPRSEGGPNEPENLIVLCPNCHRKADSGVISKSKLEYRVREQMESSGIES